MNTHETPRPASQRWRKLRQRSVVGERRRAEHARLIDPRDRTDRAIVGRITRIADYAYETRDHDRV